MIKKATYNLIATYNIVIISLTSEYLSCRRSSTFSRIPFTSNKTYISSLDVGDDRVEVDRGVKAGGGVF